MDEKMNGYFEGYITKVDSEGKILIRPTAPYLMELSEKMWLLMPTKPIEDLKALDNAIVLPYDTDCEIKFNRECLLALVCIKANCCRVGAYIEKGNLQSWVVK